MVTSQVNFYVLDPTGAVVVSSGPGTGQDDNTATQAPLQDFTVPAIGDYTVVMKVIKGPSPTHVEFMQFGQQSDNDLIVNQQFRAAGGTYYPTTAGHNSASATIGVGAVPWWAPSPFLGQTPVRSEPFSSSGPSIIVRNPDGSLLTTAQTVQNPDDHRARWRQHLVLRRRPASTPATRRSRASRQPRPTCRKTSPASSARLLPPPTPRPSRPS